MTVVKVQAVEYDATGQRSTIVLEIDVRTFTAGAQFGELGDAITFAQKVVKAANKIKG